MKTKIPKVYLVRVELEYNTLKRRKDDEEDDLEAEQTLRHTYHYSPRPPTMDEVKNHILEDWTHQPILKKLLKKVNKWGRAYFLIKNLQRMDITMSLGELYVHQLPEIKR